MDRYRSDTMDAPFGHYEGAGKRRKIDPGRPVLTHGRHRAPQKRSSGVRLPDGAPRLAGAVALAAAVAGSLMTSVSGGVGTVDEVALYARGARPGALDQRDRSVSRSDSRPLLIETSPRLSQVARLARQRSRALDQVGRQAELRAWTLRRQWAPPLRSYRITGTFGERSYLWSTVHTGLDFAAPTGTAISAVARGQVTQAGWAGAYGYRTIVTLPDGTEIWYCHQARVDVSAGDEVDRGQAIGTVGSTGNVTGPHLHLEVRPGGRDPVDPRTAFIEHGVEP